MDVRHSVEAKQALPLLSCIESVLQEVDLANSHATLVEKDVQQIQYLLEDDNHDQRRRMEEFFSTHKAFRPYFNLSLDESRRYCMSRLQAFCQAGLISVSDFHTNPGNIFLAHELAGMMDGSFASQMVVQFNLFGGTILRQGSKEHRDELLAKVDGCHVVGCYALTELGYGNNTTQLETTATLDSTADEWIINSPTPLSQKCWVGNGAVHGDHCIVFAQMIVHGVHQGIHGFLVRIRDEQGKLCNGVRTEDMGPKIGLNGIDSARIIFDNLRVSRSALLSANAQVDKNGVYHNDIINVKERFFQMADQILPGRLCVAAMSLGGSKVLLTNTLTYACTRMGVGPSGKSDVPIIEYQLFQHQIFPLLAKLLALTFYYNHCKRSFHSWAVGDGECDHFKMSLLVSSIKPMAATFFNSAAIICRERVAGISFLAANGFGDMYVHSCNCVTAEGDSAVLNTKVARQVLELKKQRGLGLDWDITATDSKSFENVCLDDRASMIKCLKQMKQLLAARVHSKVLDLESKIEEAETCQNGVWKDLPKRHRYYKSSMEEHSMQMQGVSKAYAEWNAFYFFSKAIENKVGNQRAPNAASTPLSDAASMALMRCNILYGVQILKEDIGWFMVAGLMPCDAINNLNSIFESSCKALRPDIMQLVNALGVKREMNRRPMAHDWRSWNEVSNFGEVVDLRHFEKSTSDN